MIDANERNEIEVIRELRNACAHSRLPISFKTQEVATLCRPLLSADPAIKAPNDSTLEIRITFAAKCLKLQAVLYTGRRITTPEEFHAFLESEEGDDALSP